MPVCRNCNEKFPNRIKIDGKYRVLSSRKFCLGCSPYGLHNTRPYPKSQSPLNKEVVCSSCNRMYVYVRGKGHKVDTCNSCIVNINKNTRITQCIQYLGGKCIKCGYNKCSRALCFHHRDPSSKTFTISGNYCRSWDSLKAELDKCDLLCSNCHNEIHYELDRVHGSGLEPEL